MAPLASPASKLRARIRYRLMAHRDQGHSHAGIPLGTPSCLPPMPRRRLSCSPRRGTSFLGVPSGDAESLSVPPWFFSRKTWLLSCPVVHAALRHMHVDSPRWSTLIFPSRPQLGTSLTTVALVQISLIALSAAIAVVAVIPVVLVVATIPVVTIIPVVAALLVVPATLIRRTLLVRSRNLRA
jgi:hypothetical protein